MSDKIVLKVGGMQYSGWTSVTVVKSLQQMTGSFGLATTDIFPGQAKKWNIVMSDECVVEIDDQKVITGYVEDISPSYDDRNHNIQFGGRDKTGDLVDCSYDGTVNEWKGLTVAKAIEKLTEPFGIAVIVDSSVTEDANYIWSESFKANEGDTVFDLITHIASMKGILPVSYGDGKLTLTRAGTGYKAHDILQTGKNILKGNLEQSDKDRFRTYIVKGQGEGNDEKTEAETYTGPSARVTDEVVRRYRPMVVFTETKADAGRCMERARWEKNHRAGNSRSIIYVVQGWSQSNGKIWPLNSMVQVKDSSFGINETLLISELNFTVNESGTVTRMKLMHPDAFTVKKDIKGVKSGWDELVPASFR